MLPFVVVIYKRYIPIHQICLVTLYFYSLTSAINNTKPQQTKTTTQYISHFDPQQARQRRLKPAARRNTSPSQISGIIQYKVPLPYSSLKRIRIQLTGSLFKMTPGNVEVGHRPLLLISLILSPLTASLPQKNPTPQKMEDFPHKNLLKVPVGQVFFLIVPSYNQRKDYVDCFFHVLLP